VSRTFSASAALDCHRGSLGAGEMESITAGPQTKKDTEEIHGSLTEIPVLSLLFLCLTLLYLSVSIHILQCYAIDIFDIKSTYSCGGYLKALDAVTIKV